MHLNAALPWGANQFDLSVYKSLRTQYGSLATNYRAIVEDRGIKSSGSAGIYVWVAVPRGNQI